MGVPGRNRRGNACACFRQRREIAQVNQVEGHLTGSNQQRAPFLEVNVSAAFDQIHRNAGLDPPHGSHAAGHDQHATGPKASAGDADTLVIPAMAEQLSFAAVQTLTPEAGLTLGIHRNLHPLLRLEHRIGASAQHQMDAATCLQEQLKGAFGQRLGGGTCDSQHIGMHGQMPLRVTAIGCLGLSTVLLSALLSPSSAVGSGITSRSI